MQSSVRVAAALIAGAVALTVAGCGEPTRTEQADAHLRAALEHMALGRWDRAGARLDRAERLAPGAGEVARMRALLSEASTRVEPAPPLERLSTLDLSDVDWGGGGAIDDRTVVDLLARAALPGAVAARVDPRLQRALPGEHGAVTDLRKVVGSRKVTFTFEATPLDEVVSFLSDVTGLLFVVPPWLEHVRLTLRVRDVLLVDALVLIAEATGTYLRLGEVDVLSFS